MQKCIYILLLMTAGLSSYSQVIKTDRIPRQPFLKYSSLYSSEDSTTWYLSQTSATKQLPLVIFIQGSGNTSLFAENSGRISPRYGHMTWYDVSNDRYRVLVVEKPGVNYLQQDTENPAFDKQFSLEKWTGSIVEAVNQVLNSASIDKSKIMIAGHSEGGVVAASVAQKLKGLITHVTIMAGEGTTQLYSLYKFAEEGIFFNDAHFSTQQRVDSLENSWARILADPLSTSKKFWGFTYLRWSSFLKTSVLEQLTDFTGKIRIVQGENDKNVLPESAKILYTSLLSKGRQVELNMVKDADHSFYAASNSNIDGWRMVIENTIQWFLNK